MARLRTAFGQGPIGGWVQKVVPGDQDLGGRPSLSCVIVPPRRGIRKPSGRVRDARHATLRAAPAPPAIACSLGSVREWVLDASVQGSDDRSPTKDRLCAAEREQTNVGATRARHALTSLTRRMGRDPRNAVADGVGQTARQPDPDPTLVWQARRWQAHGMLRVSVSQRGSVRLLDLADQRHDALRRHVIGECAASGNGRLRHQVERLGRDPRRHRADAQVRQPDW